MVDERSNYSHPPSPYMVKLQDVPHLYASSMALFELVWREQLISHFFKLPAYVSTYLLTKDVPSSTYLPLSVFISICLSIQLHLVETWVNLKDTRLHYTHKDPIPQQLEATADTQGTANSFRTKQQQPRCRVASAAECLRRRHNWDRALPQRSDSRSEMITRFRRLWYSETD